MGFLDATFILLKKNTLLSFRDSGALTITLLAGFLSMLVLYFSQLSLNDGVSFRPEELDDPNPIPRTISTIPRCVPFSTGSCFTLAYVPSTNLNVVGWVNEVAQRSGIPLNETIAFATEEELNQHFVSNPNTTQAAYIFDADALSDISNENVRFTIQFNETWQFDFPLGKTPFFSDVVVPSMVHNMNQVLMPLLSGKSLDVNLNVSVFPHPPIVDPFGAGAVDAFANYGPVLTFATYFLSLVFFLYKIVLEKERGLRGAMRLAGQWQVQHYISWFIPMLVVNTLLTLLMIGFGRAFGFKFFKVMGFGITFLTMFIFSLSLIGWTFLLSTVVGKSTSVSIISFNFFILGYMLATSGAIVYIIKADGTAAVGENVFWLRQLFAIFPGTPYVKALNDLSISAVRNIAIPISGAGDSSEVFPVRECWFWMLGSGAVAFVLSIYLDNIIPIKHGVALSPLYLFQRSYWMPGKVNMDFSGDPDPFNESETTQVSPDGISNFDPDVEDEDVRKEREAVNSGMRDDAALVIKGLTKKFRDNLAVDDVSFSVKKGTAFALLGHNGAGKSTLFNMLVTALKPTGGDAFIFGHSVRRDQAQVRKLLGVCPQFDMYWDHLTGIEHIEIIAALKGLNKVERREEIEERLADVELTAKGNIYAGSYSGGMQRRLSVALSLTGDPKIILLDECTSGADPLVRRDLWAAIQRAKKGRVVFLITHSIAEAQHIAGNDQIGIMARGKLRVLGNALHLKTKFGAGYSLVVVMNSTDETGKLTEVLGTVCPGSQLVDTTMGDRGEALMHYSLPRQALESDVLRTVEFLENNKADYGVREYSINSASLGEVFKSITALSEDVHHEGDLESDDTPQKLSEEVPAEG